MFDDNEEVFCFRFDLSTDVRRGATKPSVESSVRSIDASVVSISETALVDVFRSDFFNFS